MNDDYIGSRINLIRKEIYKESQEEMVNLLNNYLSRTKEGKENKEKGFTQFIISVLENSSKISKEKFTILLNFFYDTKRINPAWIIIKNNKTIPKFSTKLVIDKNLVEKQKELQVHAQEIHRIVNDINIIIENSVFD